MDMDLNYRHLRAFHAVARSGTLTEAASRLNVAQSAVSTQIRTLEERLGQPLFLREGRSLVLTEAGRIALDHAERIFGTGRALVSALKGDAKSAPLRVGAEATLSRNFQIGFLRPALGHGTEIALRSGAGAALIEALDALDLDIVLTTDPPEDRDALQVTRIATQKVVFHAAPERLDHPDLKALLDAEPVILPGARALRAGFDALAARLGASPRIVAEVDDMAMLRLLAREGAGLALVPSVVLVDEIAAGRLAAAPFETGLWETFFAVTAVRSHPHPEVARLIAAARGSHR